MSIFSKWFGKTAEPPPVASGTGKPTTQLPPGILAAVEWRNNEIHLMLLQRFLDLGTLESGVPSHWESELGEPPIVTVQRFIQMGLLTAASLARTVEYRHSAAELKTLAKERGLKVSGRKDELAQRLVDTDSTGMEILVREKPVFTCSQEARAVVEQYMSAKSDALDLALNEVRSSLAARDFATAIVTARTYQSKQIVILPPNPLLLTEPTKSLDEEVAYLKTVFSLRPKILQGLNSEDRESLAAAIVLGHLFNKSPANFVPSTFKGLPKFTQEVTVRMMEFHVMHMEQIDKWRVAGVKKASVQGCGDSCEACKKLAGKVGKLDDLPELPYENCTCRMGCRCTLNPQLPF